MLYPQIIIMVATVTSLLQRFIVVGDRKLASKEICTTERIGTFGIVQR